MFKKHKEERSEMDNTKKGKEWEKESVTLKIWMTAMGESKNKNVFKAIHTNSIILLLKLD